MARQLGWAPMRSSTVQGSRAGCLSSCGAARGLAEGAMVQGSERGQERGGGGGNRHCGGAAGTEPGPAL